MSRLDEIATRNRHPWRLKGTLAFGLRSLFLLVILGLLIFTDWARSPPDDRPGVLVIPTPQPPSVHDVKLWKPPVKPAAAARP